MKASFSDFRKKIKIAFAISLMAIAFFDLTSFSAEKVAKKWPVRNFLPPVAQINPKIELETPDDMSLDVVSLSAVTTPTLTTRPRLEGVKKALDIHSADSGLKTLEARQKKVEEADLKNLWDATVERNPVIRFALEKLATPEEVHAQQSSVFMRKTLNVLISGATLASSMIPGGGGYRNLGVMAGGDAVRNLTLGNPQEGMENRLSPTEKIQLAGLIDDLQRKVVETYQQYRVTLNDLADAHQKTLAYNQGYTEAMSHSNAVLQAEGNNNVSVNRVLLLMSSGSAYHKAHLHEEQLRHEAMDYRVQLERMAGRETVETLKLTIDSDDIAKALKPETSETLDKKPSSQVSDLESLEKPISPSSALSSVQEKEGV